MIAIPYQIAEDMLIHAGEAAPVEACGLLVGNSTKVKKGYRLTNVDASPEHFSLDPKEQFAVVKDARKEGWELLAVYHSHPATPARMSEEDLRLAAAPGMQFVIVSLADPAGPRIKAFTVVEGRAVEEPVAIQE